MGSLSLNIGLRALLTSQSALENIGHNISNANTPGYSRQNLELSAAPELRLGSLKIGTGVQANVVKRTVDELLNKRLLQQISSLGRLDARVAGMSQVETLFGAGSESGIAAQLQRVFTSVSDLSVAPEDAVLRTALIQSGVQFSGQINDIQGNLKTIQRDAERKVQSLVNQVNVLAERISILNGRVRDSESAGLTANDLRDQRDLALSQLSELIDVKSFENPQGAIRVLAAGGLLVHPGGFNQMAVSEGPDGDLGVQIEDGSGHLSVTGGEIGGLVQQVNEYLPKVQAELDAIAFNAALEFNRIHSTGVPTSGPLTGLKATNALMDRDLDGQIDDELLNGTGLPFEIVSGEVFVNVTNTSDGSIERHRIAIDAKRTTVGDFLNELNSIPNLNASLSSSGHLTLLSDSGFAFDFGRGLDQTPDPIGSFGGVRASLGTSTPGPFSLSDGDTLQLTGNPGSVTITFDQNDFYAIGSATAEEVAAAINANPQTAANDMLASVVGDHLVLQTMTGGSTQSFTVNGGAATAALGLTAGTTVVGSDLAVDVVVGGQYTGGTNRQLTFEPNMDGTIGTTAGLVIDVYDEQGQKVDSLNVGAGYTPGNAIETIDGVTVSFTVGDVSATYSDRFALDVTADSDTSDVLAAIGLNTFFVGSNATDLSVRDDLVLDPSKIAASVTGAPGDGGTLLDLLALEQTSLTALDGSTLAEGLAETINGVGIELSSATSSQEAEQFLMDGLSARRDEISGVNVDEELVRLIEFEQAFSAASQYIRVMSEVGEELIALA